MPDRSLSALLLPVNKDSQMKEEGAKLVNGNSGDPIDRVLFVTSYFFSIRFCNIIENRE